MDLYYGYIVASSLNTSSIWTWKNGSVYRVKTRQIDKNDMFTLPLRIQAGSFTKLSSSNIESYINFSYEIHVFLNSFPIFYSTYCLIGSDNCRRKICSLKNIIVKCILTENFVFLKKKSCAPFDVKKRKKILCFM